MNSHQLVELILACLQDLLEQRGLTLPAEEPGGLVLYGSNALLDSLGLVTLVTDVEQAIADQAGASITIADDRAMSQRNSPFRTVQSLADYVLQLLKEQGPT